MTEELRTVRRWETWLTYGGGYLEGWVTRELLYLQYQNTIGRG